MSTATKPSPLATAAAVGAASLGLLVALRLSSRQRGSSQPPAESKKLLQGPPPASLSVARYFPQLHEFEHKALFDASPTIFNVLDGIGPYVKAYVKQKRQEVVTSGSPAVMTMVLSPSSQSKSNPFTVVGSAPADVMLHPDEVLFEPERLVAPDKEPSTSDEAFAYIIVSRGARVRGGVIDVSEGPIYLGENVTIEPGAYLKGPAVIGDGSTLRMGAYIRGNALIGRKVVLRLELKNAVVMDQAEMCHPGYCGDSVCGFKSHFGNQVTTANLPMTTPKSILLQTGAGLYDTGRRKLGLVLGDHAQLGCGTVTEPGAFVGPHTLVYPLSRIKGGVYPSHSIVKNKPMESGVIEIVPMESR